MIFVAKNGTFLEKEFRLKEVSGRNVELDEVIVPLLEIENCTSQKPFLRCLNQLERKQMIMIMKLRIKLLLNFVGQAEHDLHQSGTESCPGSHVISTRQTYKLLRSYDEPRF